MKKYSILLLFLIVLCKPNEIKVEQNMEYNLKKFVHLGMDEGSFIKFTEIANWKPATDVVPRGIVQDTFTINEKKIYTKVHSAYHIYVQETDYDTTWLVLQFCDFNNYSYLRKYFFSNEKVTIKNLFGKIKSFDSLSNCK